MGLYRSMVAGPGWAGTQADGTTKVNSPGGTTRVSSSVRERRVGSAGYHASWLCCAGDVRLLSVGIDGLVRSQGGQLFQDAIWEGPEDVELDVWVGHRFLAAGLPPGWGVIVPIEQHVPVWGGNRANRELHERVGLMVAVGTVVVVLRADALEHQAAALGRRAGKYA